MSNPVKPYTFADATDAEADQVNANFDAIFDWIADEAMHADASVAFSAIPSGPASDPSTDNQLSRKKYVDDSVKGRVKMIGRGGALVGSPPALASMTIVAQAGTATATTDGTGGATVNFPAAFPNGVLVVLTEDDNAFRPYEVTSVAGQHSTTAMRIALYDSRDGSLNPNAGPFTFSYLAIGW